MKLLLNILLPSNYQLPIEKIFFSCYTYKLTLGWKFSNLAAEQFVKSRQ